MINNIFKLGRAAQAGFAPIGEHFFEKVTVVFLLCCSENQAGIRSRILRLEFTDALEVSRIGDNRGEFLDLFELVQFRVGFHDA